LFLSRSAILNISFCAPSKKNSSPRPILSAFGKTAALQKKKRFDHDLSADRF